MSETDLLSCVDWVAASFEIVYSIFPDWQFSAADAAAGYGVHAALAAGLANGAFWTFAPLFAQARSTTSLDVSLFMSATVVRGALSQWPIGQFSDLMDRRRISCRSVFGKESAKRDHGF
jgi:MFS family permease